MKTSERYIALSHGAVAGMFGGAIFDFDPALLAFEATLAIVCAVLSATHAIKETQAESRHDALRRAALGEG